jgi:tripartite-type tricarboxylate transporter receptor subunit TctC
MRVPVDHALARALVSCLLLLMGSAAQAQQGFPSRPITIVVPYAPGGTNDLMARAVAAKMGDSMGQPVLVENRPGAGGNMGAAHVAKSAPDGHTILTASVGVYAINKWLHKSLPYDPEKDFAPITNGGSVPNMLIAHPSVPVKDVGELISYARSHPGKVAFASMGSGTTGHLAGELFKQMTGADLLHVPYKGSAPALQDLVGGQVQLMFDNMPTALKLAQSGKVRGLALTSLQPHPLAPGVPTLDAAGLKGFDVTAWFGFAAPAATPKPVIERLNAEMVKALRDAAVASSLTQLGVTIVADSSAHFAAYMGAQSRRWKDIVERSGVRLD